MEGAQLGLRLGAGVEQWLSMHKALGSGSGLHEPPRGQCRLCHTLSEK